MVIETPPDLAGRGLLKLIDITDAQMLALVALSARLKARRRERPAGPGLLAGKNIALLFEKASTRTRCAATVAAAQEGAHAEYLGRADIHLGKKESVADTARVLGRMFDAILFRGFAQDTVETLGAYAGVPVWNGLTDRWHPSQILGDLLTIEERFGTLRGLRVAFVGDGRNNVCNSLMVGCAKAGIDFVDCCPAELAPDPEVVALAREAAERNGSTVTISHDPESGVVGAHVVYTDVWVSMGEEARFEERLALLRPFSVDMAMIRRTGRLDTGDVLFLHCLPAFHNTDTELTRALGALEVTDDVFEAPFSGVFDEAENRVHSLKAMMVASLATP